PAAGLGLALEARDRVLHVRIGEVVGQDRLDRDLALDHRVEALVHHPHRATPERARDVVLADGLGDLGHVKTGDRPRFSEGAWIRRGCGKTWSVPGLLSAR